MKKEEPNVEEQSGERTQTQWNQKGFKKLDVVIIKSKHGQQRVDVRFNKDSGFFGASLADMTFTSRDYHALVAKLSAHLMSIESLVYERYILINYDERHESTRGRGGSKEWRGSKDHGDRPVSGIYLEFDVYDISNDFDVAVHSAGPRGTSKARVWRRMRRDDSEWAPDGDDETRHIYDEDDDLKELVPYTDDRYQTLVGIKDGFQNIAAILNGMFGEKAMESGKSITMLDAMSGQKLLPAPPELEKPKKKGRKR